MVIFFGLMRTPLRSIFIMGQGIRPMPHIHMVLVMFAKKGENTKLLVYFSHEIEEIYTFLYKIRAGCEKENLKYKNRTHLLFRPRTVHFCQTF